MTDERSDPLRAQPLAGVQVLELATGVAGPFAGKLFADFGAEVVKVEPPDGDPARRHGPFPDELHDRPVNDPERLENSALFLHLNANKRSIVLDLDRQDDLGLLEQLIQDSDVVVESFAPGYLDARGVGYERMEKLNPDVVVVSITPFGQSGPYAAYQGEDIVIYAMGGPMFSTGVETREPVKLGGNLTTYQCGNLAAAAAMSALVVAERSGRGVHIDLSMFEAQAGSVDRRVSYLLWYLWSGLVVGRQPLDTLRALPNGFFETADGHVLVFTLPMWIDRMLKVLDDDDLRVAFEDPDWMRNDDLVDELQACFIPWLFAGDNRDRAEVGQREKWAVTPLNAPVALIDDRHFVDRGFFVETDHPVAGRFRQPGAPFRIGDHWDSVWQLRRPAPTLGQHTEELRAELAGHASGQAPPETSATAPIVADQRLPLEGIRVLDLTVVWAGPSCTMHLSDLGAEVIRVDNAWVFPPATRGNSPRPAADLLVDMGPLGGGYPNLDVSGRPWNKHSMWAAQARNKLSCTLDIRKSEGREAFFRLVEQSDVFVENNSVDTLDKLGIGWEELHRRNPRLIVVRMPPMGIGGPYASYVGFGASFEALCGLTRLRGYTDDDPTTTSAAFHMDPTTGAAGTFAVLCALRRRDRTGVGELVEFSQGENMMHHIGEYLVDATRSGRSHGPGGNRHISRAPQGCYRCVGSDRWVVLSIGTDEQWGDLCRLMHRPDLAEDPRLSSLAGRLEHHDELDEAITEWTCLLDRWDVFERCQSQGIPAGPVLDEADTYLDPHLIERGFFREQGSEDVGRWQFPGHQWKWTAPAMRWEPICRLGADNEAVLKGVAGLTAEEYDHLAARGHLSLDYLKPDGTPY